MILLRNIGLLATCRAPGGQGAIHAVPRAALVHGGGRILWAGPERDLPSSMGTLVIEDAEGALVVPGLVDSHTHLAFGGWRADEFELRARGASYLDIARAGGGIASTMRATRAASADELEQRAAAALAGMLALGVTTVEAKSGYGLTLDDELRLLRLYRALDARGPQRIVPTLLAAHVVPPEYRDRRAAYVEMIVGQLLPRVAAESLARFCDVFVEDTAFSEDEARRVCHAALALGIRPKLHADQLTDSGGAALAAELGAASADHLECINPRGIAALAAAGVVAGSLPLASLYLRQPALPARALIDAGVAVAVATDFNPGSAPSWHLPLAMTLACTLQGMTPAEALKGATLYGARSVGLEDEVGSLEEGKRADFALIDAPDVNHWLYHFRPNACVRTVIGGQTVYQLP